MTRLPPTEEETTQAVTNTDRRLRPFPGTILSQAARLSLSPRNTNIAVSTVQTVIFFKKKKTI